MDERIHLAISSESEDINIILRKYRNEIMEETLAISMQNALVNMKYEKCIVLGDCNVNLQISSLLYKK